MINKRLFYLACLAAIALLYIPCEKLSAQTISPGNSLAAVITSASGAERHLLTQDYIVDRVGLGPNQVVAVTLQFPTALGGKPVAVTPFDGGEATANYGMENLAVGRDGTVSFSFQAGWSPGLYRLGVQLDAYDYRLEFWVLDPGNPQRNPPRLQIVN